MILYKIAQKEVDESLSKISEPNLKIMVEMDMARLKKEIGETRQGEVMLNDFLRMYHRNGEHDFEKIKSDWLIFEKLMEEINGYNGLTSRNHGLFGQFLMNLFKEYPLSENLMEFIVFQNNRWLQFLPNVSDDLAKKFVTTYPERIWQISNPSEEVQMLAIKDNLANFHNIVNPSERVQMYLIDKDLNKAEWKTNPSVCTQMEIWRRIDSGEKSRWMYDYQRDVFSEILNIFKYKLCTELQILLAKNRPELFSYLDNPDQEALNMAFETMFQKNFGAKEIYNLVSFANSHGKTISKNINKKYIEICLKEMKEEIQ